ncbi:tetratricopeptide repeat protein [Saccharothrix sp. AJ9571]|nr:tetratricopeptide repeat protein [Saccharothrix sp. AJ9571]
MRPLLPACPGSLVLVTSRSWLPGLATLHPPMLKLDVFDDDAGLALLRTALDGRVDAEPDAARRLVTLCGGQPIALAITAARLATRPRWTLTHAVTAVTDGGEHLSNISDGGVSVQDIFDLAYDALDPGSARLYRLLGMCPGPDFSTAAAAAAGALPVADTATHLTTLVDAHLLDDDGGRYRFHDLLRRHAAQRCRIDDSDAERAGAVRRLTEWYLDAAIAADLVVMPLRHRHGPRYPAAHAHPPAYPDSSAALDWLESHLNNFLAVLHAATAHRWWQLVWQLCEALWGLFLYRKHFEQWIAAHTLGIHAARTAGDPVAEARLRVQLGIAHLTLHDHDTAAPLFADALRLAHDAGDAHTQATAREHLGLVARDRARHEEALEHFERALALNETLHDRRGIVLTERRIGETLAATDRHPEALPHLRRAETLAGKLGDTVLLARARTSLTRTYLALDAVTRRRRSQELVWEIQRFVLAPLVGTGGRGRECLVTRL